MGTRAGKLPSVVWGSSSSGRSPASSSWPFLPLRSSREALFRLVLCEATFFTFGGSWLTTDVDGRPPFGILLGLPEHFVGDWGGISFPKQ